LALGVPDLLQRPPQRRIRGHRPEQLGLIPQHGQVRQHPTAVGDAHRGVDQHPAPVVHRAEPTPRQRPRQRTGQPRCCQPATAAPPTRHATPPRARPLPPSDPLTTRYRAPEKCSSPWVFCDFSNRILPAQGHFSLSRHGQPKITVNTGGWWANRVASPTKLGLHNWRSCW
jgi:hypothetical protein